MKISFSFVVCFFISITAFATAQPACGLQGTVQERIVACAQADADHPAWKLVARSDDGSEVWLDGATNILWSQTLRRPGYGSALKRSFTQATSFCAEQANAVELAGLVETWRLPSIEEYKAALEANPSVIRDHVGYEFWSGTEIDKDYAWSYQGAVSVKQFKVNSRAIRCVAAYDPNFDANPPTSSPGSPLPLPIAEVQRVMTKLKWSNGHTNWSSSLEFDHCNGSSCFVRNFLYSDQVCDSDAPNGAWCESILKAGDVKFSPGGFQFREYATNEWSRCDLSFEPAIKKWWLKGNNCDFLGLSASE